jgi:hypothetical protein
MPTPQGENTPYVLLNSNIYMSIKHDANMILVIPPIGIVETFLSLIKSIIHPRRKTGSMYI